MCGCRRGQASRTGGILLLANIAYRSGIRVVRSFWHKTWTPVISSTSTHRELVIDPVHAGKPFFCEEPMGSGGCAYPGRACGKRAFPPNRVSCRFHNPIRITIVPPHSRLFQAWPLAEQVSLRSIPGAALFDDPALKGRSGDAIDLPGGHHVEECGAGGFWEATACSFLPRRRTNAGCQRCS
jgi:hypothetical protein